MVKLSGYLEQRRQGFEAVVDVPPSLRAAVGRRRFRLGLATRDVHIARARLLKAVITLHERINAACRMVPTVDPLMTEALALREGYQAVLSGDIRGFTSSDDAQSIIIAHVQTRAESIAETQGAARADTFGKIAMAISLPFTLHVTDWLSEPGAKGVYRGRTALDYRRMVEGFAFWMGKEGIGATVEAVTRRVAGRYLAALHGQSLSPARVRTVVAALSGYHQWLTRRGLIPDDSLNPWVGQAPRKAQGVRQEPERAFTDDEVATLLSAPPDACMADLMHVAALSGMRLEEACRLTVGMSQDGVFKVPGTKTRSAKRDVPIHSGLAEIVRTRSNGKPVDGFLFHELGDPDRHGDRSAAFSKRFGRYRESLGVHEKELGRRRSRVNFHSWRRWHITTALRAGQPSRVVSQVVGHQLSGMTEGVYFSGDTIEAKRACVEAVCMPMVG